MLYIPKRSRKLHPMVEIQFREASRVVQDLRLPKVETIHPFHELILVTEGRYRVELSQELLMDGGPDDIFIYPAGTEHRLLHEQDGTCVIHVLQWSGFSPFPNPVQVTDNARRALFCLQWLEDLHDPDAVLIPGSREVLVQLVLEECLRLQAGERSGGHDPVSRAASYLEHNLQYAQTVHLVCQVAGYRPSRLFEEFRRVKGCGPMAYLSRLRARRAVQLALTSRLPLRVIAQQVGLTSASHLSRLIHKEFGRSLGALRRSASALAPKEGAEIP